MRSDSNDLEALVGFRPFSRMPFLSPPDPIVQLHAKERMFLHGVKQAVAAMDLPCDWAQFLYTCAERGMEDSALIVIATWHREGPVMTQQYYISHGHPDGVIMTSLLAYHWFCAAREHHRHCHTDWNVAWEAELTSDSRIGMLRHVTLHLGICASAYQDL